MRRLSLLAPTTLDKLKKDSQDWAAVLYGVIPLTNLYPIFLAAYREHKPGFPMECAEMLQEWYRQKAGSMPSTGVLYSEKCALCLAHNSGNNQKPCPFHQTKDRPSCHRCGVPHDALPMESLHLDVDKRTLFDRCFVCDRFTIPKEEEYHRGQGTSPMRCIATAELEPGRTIRCQLTQGHKSVHTYDFKVDESLVLQPPDLVTQTMKDDSVPPGTYVEDKLKEVLEPAEPKPCSGCEATNDRKFHREEFFQANPELFVECPVCHRQTKPAPFQKSEE